MDLEDVDDFFDVPAGPPVRNARRPGPVRAATPPEQNEVKVKASGVFGGFGFKASGEPRPFTPLSDAGEPVGGAPDAKAIPVGGAHDAKDIQAGGRKSTALPPQPSHSPAPKSVDKATFLLQQLEQKAEQQKAGAWGRPTRSSAAAKAAPTSADAAVSSPSRGDQPSTYNSQGAAPPVLNDNKIEFARRRWLQTNLGGLKLLTSSGCAPPGFLIAQILLWLLPVAIGLPLCMVAASMSLAPVIAGAAMFAIHGALQIARRSGGSRVAPGEASGKASMLREEDEIDFGLLSRQGLSFLVPALGWAAVPYALCSAALVAVATVYLSPVSVSTALGEGATAAYLPCGWLCVALAGYSLNAQPPPEANRYCSDDNGGVLGPTSRALHMLLVMVPAIALPGCDMVYSRALCASLPLFWATGSLPPADCLIEWALEQVHVHLHGGSPGVCVCVGVCERACVSVCVV